MSARERITKESYQKLSQLEPLGHFKLKLYKRANGWYYLSYHDKYLAERELHEADPELSYVQFSAVAFIISLLLWLVGKKVSIDETSRRSLTRLFSCLASTAIFLAALHIVGIPLTAFAFLGGAIAIGIGFGTQNLFKNLMSGILLTLKRPFRLGNIIEVGGVSGVVFDVGVSATIIRSFDGKEIVIPNSELLEQQVVNWGLNDPLLRKSIEVGVEYGSSPKLVRETLLSVVAAHPDVLKEPEPRVLLSNYGDSSLVFTVYFWLNQRHSSGVLVSAQLREDILEALDKAGLSMAYPHMDVNLFRGSRAGKGGIER